VSGGARTSDNTGKKFADTQMDLPDASVVARWIWHRSVGATEDRVSGRRDLPRQALVSRRW